MKDTTVASLRELTGGEVAGLQEHLLPSRADCGGELG